LHRRHENPFKDPRDRDAARTFMDLLDQANADESS
jgi:hypothetical protein